MRFLPNYSLNIKVMKKRDLLLAGLFLCTIPAFGQPGVNEPKRYSDDAKMIFMQNFETADPAYFNPSNGIRLNPDENRPTTLYTWSATPVDKIEQVTYYKREGSSNPSGGTNIYNGEKEWEVAGIRDTLMNLYDGILKTDAVQPDDSLLAYDVFSIERHTSATQQGTKGLDRFGENGGRQYFQYKSASSRGINGKNVANSSSDNGGYVPEYRRNLFVRNIPIEASSSYRVTVFIKPTKIADKAEPRIGLDLLRGYFHSEKPFIADLKGRQEKQWWGGTSTVYDAFQGKSNYTSLEEGNWNKIVLMAYYNNDSIGNASPYLLSYYWAGDWNWRVQRDKDGNVVGDLGRNKARNAAGQLVNETDPSKIKDTVTLTFIQQPAKYFVRLSFRSDSTQFDVDNLSLTKSWIGGVEHHNDLIRVAMGYETNMGDLAQAALEKNKIAAVELPGEYFEVWCRRYDETAKEYFWELTPINSAEYHGDGYMYMWTKPYEDGDLRSFEGADSVLVTFRNPVDRPDLKLYYTGNTYPNGQDPEWRDNKDKRVVFDFHNEISSLNPNIDYSNGKKVLSLKDLPPVLQRQPYEAGTFGLDPNLKEMTFKFSRQIYFQNTGDENTNGAFIKVVGNGATEYWEFKQYASATDTNTVIVRPAKYNTPLAGDYTITIDQITHIEDADLTDADSYGSDVVLNLHFGDFNVNAKPSVVMFSNWRADIENYNDASGRPLPTSLYLQDGNDSFRKGNGSSMGTKCGLYPITDDTITVYGTRIPDNCAFYLSGRTGNKEGHLYSIVTLQKGNYNIEFKFNGHGSNNKTMGLKFFAKPTGTLEDGNEKGFATLDGVANKTVLEAGNKPGANQSSYGLTYKWKDGTKTVSYPFSVPANGDYVFEFIASGSSNYEGIALSNYWITSGGDLSFGPVSKINIAIDEAAAKIAVAKAAAKYQGSAYDALNNVKTAAEGFIAAKKATNLNIPSEYAAEADLINKSVKALQSRIDLIDAFFKTLDDAQAKVDIYKTADSLAAYKNLPDVQALQDLKNSYANFDYASKNDAAVTAEQNKVKAAIAGIDNRVALAQVYPDALVYAKAMKDTAAAKGLDHAALDAAIAAAEAFDDGALTYAELRAYMADLTTLALKTVYKNDIDQLARIRVNYLDSIAKVLGADAYYPTGFAAGLASVGYDDNDSISEVIKCAIKIAIYDKIVKGQPVENIDLTPFIKNHYLYATVKGVVNRYDRSKAMDQNKESMTDLTGAAQVMSVYHRYAGGVKDSMIYVMIPAQEYADVFPGWNMQSVISGNTMVSPDLSIQTAPNILNGKMVFDGQLTMDWTSKAEIKQTVEGLPVGVYSIGATVLNGDKVNSANLTAVSESSYTKDIKSGDKLTDVLVLEQKLDLDYVIETGSGAGSTDNFSLTYVGKNPDPWYDQYWEQLLTNAKNELDNILTIVDRANAGAAGVEYYTISGIKLDAPKAGEILIRKTTNSNGKVVVDKVIIK